MERLINAESRKLGVGSYGSCCRVKDPDTGQVLVIKTFTGNDLNSLTKEAEALNMLQMDGVQRLVGVCVKTRQLVSHFAGKTLKYYSTERTPLLDSLSVIKQVAETLQRIHLKGYTHNDIKGNNVCVQRNRSGLVATIIDLGMARPMGTKCVYKRTTNTERTRWVAPELLLQTHPCSEASDVYSVAFLMWKPLYLRQEIVSRPKLSRLKEWVKAALGTEISERPTLGQLIRILETVNTRLTAASSSHISEHPSGSYATSEKKTSKCRDIRKQIQEEWCFGTLVKGEESSAGC